MSESPIKTIMVALGLCLVCSIMVAGVAVKFKPMQVKNADLDLKKSILSAAGMYQEGIDIDEVFEDIEVILVDFETGEEMDHIDANEFNPEKAIKDPELSIRIPDSEDVGNLLRRPKYAKVYLVKNDEAELDKIILPITSKGLWSTMRGFLALKADTKTVAGFAYYSHGETPGLGGEVDNPKWKESWIGKKVFDEEWQPAIRVSKVSKEPGQSGYEHHIDALSGSTITSNGIDNSLQYWLGESGYGVYLASLRDNENIGEEI